MSKKNVSIMSHEIKTTCIAQLIGPTKPVSHHVEGWQAVARLNKLSYMEWQGAPGWELQIPVVFDNLRSRASVVSMVHKLEALAVPYRKLPGNRPPICIIDSNGDVPHDYTESPNKRWVISGLDWGDYITVGGIRCREFCNIVVSEWIPEQITPVTPTKETPPKTYIIQPGDTLAKLAARWWGSASYWTAIAKLNNIRDPNHPKVGLMIKVPDVGLVAKYGSQTAHA